MRRGNCNEFSDCFEYPKKYLLKSSYQNKYSPKFSHGKKSRNKKSQTPKNPLIIPVTWNPEYTPPPPLGGGGGEYKIFNPGLALIGLSGIGASGVPTSNTISPGLTKIGLKMSLGRSLARSRRNHHFLCEQYGSDKRSDKKSRFTVISFHSQIVLINSQIVPQKSQVNFSKFVEWT